MKETPIIPKTTWSRIEALLIKVLAKETFEFCRNIELKNGRAATSYEVRKFIEGFKP